MPVVQAPYCSKSKTANVVGTKLLGYLSGRVIVDLFALLLSSLPHVLVSLELMLHPGQKFKLPNSDDLLKAQRHSMMLGLCALVES